VNSTSLDIAQVARLHALTSLVSKNPELLVLNQELCFVARKVPASGKVGIVSGGGSGHEPLHTGYVGYGMLDAACAGHYFSSPTPDQIVAAATQVESGAGVLFVVKNYQGDVFNFSLAAKLCPFPTALVLVSDDVATRNENTGAGRGLSGAVVVEKILGAAAETGLPLEALRRLGNRVNSRVATYGIALSSCRMPGLDRPIYDLESGTMETGVGIHGERGRERMKAGSLRDIAALMVERVVAGSVTDVAGPLMLINGLGSVTRAQLNELSSACVALLRRSAIDPVRNLVGQYATALDTNGFSLTLAALDTKMLGYWDAPVRTATLKW
jgi:phosphoenolpyruvate---glycerone phosphotransferase subunit DhaK